MPTMTMRFGDLLETTRGAGLEIVTPEGTRVEEEAAQQRRAEVEHAEADARHFFMPRDLLDATAEIRLDEPADDGSALQVLAEIKVRERTLKVVGRPESYAGYAYLLRKDTRTD